MKKSIASIIALLAISTAAGCCQKVAIPPHKPTCITALKPELKGDMASNYKAVIDYALELETEVNCYEAYFEEVKK